MLRDFSEQWDITYPLLSDEGSHEIRRLGLLNEHLEEQAGYYGLQVAERHIGVPYPGSFILDEEGVVQEKVFEPSYRVRPTAVDLLGSSFAPDSQAAGSHDAAQTPELGVTAWINSASYRPYQKIVVQFGFQVAPDLHVYGLPIPAGYFPLTVDVEPLETLEVGELELPESSPYRVEGLDEQFQVYEGEFRGRLPLLLTGNQGDVALRLRVSYQACTATECFPPNEITLELPLEGLENIRS